MESKLPIEIRPFSPVYEKQVIDLIVAIQRNEFDIPITADDQPDLKNIPEYYQSGNGNFWVALHNDKVVGTVSLLDIGANLVALRKMFVNRDYRGREIGTAQKLLEISLNWAITNGIRKIYLGTTPQFLAAHRFYEKNGFKEISKRDLPKIFPIMKVDTKFYKYVL
jgi:N-acetylglutamate synthase-like GNAT family acetyltransferase